MDIVNELRAKESRDNRKLLNRAADEDKEDKKITAIQHQTNVVQNGENNINLTNNGTINFNL